jgi:transposase
MQVTLIPEQVAELESAVKSDRSPKVRIKALVLLNLADGKAVSHVAATFRTSRQSVYAWVAEYRNGGIDGFRVSPGRGRKCRADEEEIRRYIQQSPQNFGLSQTRWTLAALAATVPSLKGFSLTGVLGAIRRAGFRHKRGQPSLHSPDPMYDEKKGLSTRR